MALDRVPASSTADATLVLSDHELQHEPVAIVIGALECADAVLVRIKADGLVAGVNVYLSDAHRRARHLLSGSEGEHSADVYPQRLRWLHGSEICADHLLRVGSRTKHGEIQQVQSAIEDRSLRLIVHAPSLSPIGARARIELHLHERVPSWTTGSGHTAQRRCARR